MISNLRRIGVFALLYMSICMLNTVDFSAAQGITPRWDMPRMPVPLDYYAPPGRGAERLLETVEQYHLTNNVISGIYGGHLQSSLDDLNYVLVHFPNHPKALLYASAIADLAHSPLLAIKYYEKAIQLFPTHAETRVLYGEYLLHIGKTAQSIEMLKNALVIDKDFAAAHAILAEAYDVNGDKELAADEKEQARRLGYKQPVVKDGEELPTTP